jgi:hypothetical protein
MASAASCYGVDHANGGAMGEVSSRAKLVDSSELEGRPGRIAATVPRAEIQKVLGIEEVPELVLDIARKDNGDVEAHTLRVALSESQLEELLRDTGGAEVRFLFDADELEKALILDEVEAHGVREKTVAVLTVAAMAAGVAASAQQASAKTSIGGGGAATIEVVSDAASSGSQQGPEMISDAASSGSVQSAELISDAASSGPSGVQASASGPELISDAASSGPSAVQASATGPELISDAASSGPLSTAQAEALASASAGSGDTGLSPSEIAGTAGAGLVLLITAAGFATRGRRRETRPV